MNSCHFCGMEIKEERYFIYLEQNEKILKKHLCKFCHAKLNELEVFDIFKGKKTFR